MLSRVQAHAAYAAVLRNPAEIRALCLADLFFLMVHVLGRKDMDNDWCYARCREVQAAPDGYIDLWAREHYKSTIITVGKTIQDILSQPEITVGIFSHTRPIAKSFLAQIKRTFEESRLLQELFPDVLHRFPKRESAKWSEDAGLIVKRSGNPKEATVEAWGLVDGQPTGKHFSLLIYDDVVTRESVSSPEMIHKVTEAWALSLNLGARGGSRRIIGTRYHANDTYREIIRRRAAAPRVRPATEDGTPQGIPVFLSQESLREKYRTMGAYVFGCQMLLNPLADSSLGFKEEWLRFWEGKLPRSNYYLLVDPASSKKESADYSAFWVVACGEDGKIYVVDGVRDRLNLAERTRELFRLHRRYRPLQVGYERYGMQADIEHIRHVQNEEGYRFDVRELGGAVSKHDRIRRLAPAFERGGIYLPRRLPRAAREGRAMDLTELFVQEEYLAFPVSRHDDMLDCLSRIYDLDLRFPGRELSRPAKAVFATAYDVAAYGLGAMR